MVDKEQVAQVIETIRPLLQAHGGDIQLVEVTDDGIVKVVLEGACKGCPMAQVTINRGVEAKLKEEVPDVQKVVPVEAPVQTAEER
jgi:Fe-S cluster biogenesis protein NfuA